MTFLFPSTVYRLPVLGAFPLAAGCGALRSPRVREAAINLHHLGEQIEGHLSDRAADLPKLSFFQEPGLLGGVGGPANLRRFPARKRLLLLSSDATTASDLASLSSGCDSMRVAPLRLLDSRDSARQTPLQAEGNRIGPLRRQTDCPLLDRRELAISPRLLRGTQPGHSSPVEDLREPLLGKRREEVGWFGCRVTSAGLGRPGDFVRSALEALDRGGALPRGSGDLDSHARVLSLVAETRWRAAPREEAVGQPLARGRHGVHLRSPRR